ncbi:MAG: hypothetical protein WCP28_09835 [Actinomycetes bacterium]
MAARTDAGGRKARTKGVSLLPEELADVQTVENLSGVGLSEVYHRHFGPQMRAAAQLLLEAQAAGMELNRSLFTTVWATTISPASLQKLYAAESELVLGD